jgi:hypothetical protein
MSENHCEFKWLLDSLGGMCYRVRRNLQQNKA